MVGKTCKYALTQFENVVFYSLLTKFMKTTTQKRKVSSGFYPIRFVLMEKHSELNEKRM